jgi:N-acylneuraminate cytidylyltransferase
MLFPEALAARSQDLPKLFCPTGAMWIAQSSVIKESRTFHVPERTFFEMPWESAVDIDDIDDFKMAEAVSLLQRDRG